MAHRTKRAPTRAYITQNQKRDSAVGEALSAIGAARAVTNCGQSQTRQQTAGLFDLISTGTPFCPAYFLQQPGWG